MLIFSGKQKVTSYIKLMNTVNHRKQIQKQTLTRCKSVLFIPLSLWSFTPLLSFIEVLVPSQESEMC